jgi:hypothetical protein
VAIVLGDGQLWQLPKPTMRADGWTVEFRPVVNADGTLSFDSGHKRFEPDFGPDYEQKLEAFMRADGGADEANALLALAWELLSRNYALAPADLGRLLPLRPNDETNNAMWQAIVDVALGRAPKLTASGSAAS